MYICIFYTCISTYVCIDLDLVMQTRMATWAPEQIESVNLYLLHIDVYVCMYRSRSIPIDIEWPHGRPSRYIMYIVYMMYSN